MSEARIEEKHGRLEKGAYASARNGHLGCIYCHLPELFSFSSQQSQMQHLKEENARCWRMDSSNLKIRWCPKSAENPVIIEQIIVTQIIQQDIAVVSHRDMEQFVHAQR
eukprot:CAMPEP_0201971930 /NCGR_PEP_ID=MMETSP0904-20121228/39536_1 /ASSEMBLY_ACC=CAM_ASM_000553 /TAXON_ID=420261 /ORGANISM="Thalassiosira antarctica, Strain CCMP982" /LENGTH=108 /DNA_ID=CAMNT_0048521557 /DNA_START=12 /DNA_END=338 /DNA_ORIENTATION=-